MTLMLAGSWRHATMEKAYTVGFARHGWQVEPFATDPYFSSLIGRAEEKYLMPGLCLRQMNRDLLGMAKALQPEVIFIWRGTHLQAETLAALRRETRAVLVSYHTDDPFSPLYQGDAPLHWRRLWRYARRAIPLYDVHFVFRQHNAAEFRAAGARHIHLLRGHYVQGLHEPRALTPEEERQYGAEVVFIGYYEPVRLQYLKALVEAGVRVRLYGPAKTWTPHVGSLLGLVRPVFGEEYVRALCGAPLALCCFSRLNRDTHTTRVFEIPACGRVLVSERTDEMRTLFEEGREAVYFSSPSELVDQVRRLLADPDGMARVARAGRARCLRDGHSAEERAAYVLNCLAADGFLAQAKAARHAV